MAWYQTTKKDTADASMKVVKSNSAPADHNTLWIDTSNASGNIGGVIKYFDTTSNKWVAVSAVWG